jgi:hypothetical protein
LCPAIATRWFDFSFDKSRRPPSPGACSPPRDQAEAVIIGKGARELCTSQRVGAWDAGGQWRAVKCASPLNLTKCDALLRHSRSPPIKRPPRRRQEGHLDEDPGRHRREYLRAVAHRGAARRVTGAEHVGPARDQASLSSSRSRHHGARPAGRRPPS